MGRAKSPLLSRGVAVTQMTQTAPRYQSSSRLKGMKTQTGLSSTLPFRDLISLLLLLPSLACAGGVVTNCTDAALRAAISGGGTVTFACDGTITLTNTIIVASD